jgi:hypothetical protein
MNRIIYLLIWGLSLKLSAFTVQISEVMVNPSFTSDAVGEFIEIYSDTLIEDPLVIVIDESDTLEFNLVDQGYTVLARDSFFSLFPQIPTRAVPLPNLVNSRSFSIQLTHKLSNEMLDSVWIPLSSKGGYSWQREMEGPLFTESLHSGITGDLESVGWIARVENKLDSIFEAFDFVWTKSQLILKPKESLNVNRLVEEASFSIFIDNNLDGQPDLKLGDSLIYGWDELQEEIPIDLLNHWTRIGVIQNRAVQYFSFCDPSEKQCGPLKVSQIYPFTQGDETEWMSWSLELEKPSIATASMFLVKNNTDSMGFWVSDFGDSFGGKKVLAADSSRFRAQFGQIRIDLFELDPWPSLSNLGGSLAIVLDGVELGYWSWDKVSEDSRAKVLNCSNEQCTYQLGNKLGDEFTRLGVGRPCSVYSDRLNEGSPFLVLEGLSRNSELKLLSSEGKVYSDFKIPENSTRLVFNLAPLALAKGRYYLKSAECLKTIYWGL